MNQPPARVRRGLTLLELTALLALVVLVACIGIPRVDLAGLRMSDAAQQVGTTMLEAQRTAILRRHSVVVAFDTARRRLRVHQDRNNDGFMQKGEPVEFVSLREGLLFGRGTASALPMGSGPITFIKTQTGLPAITFRGSGTAGEAGGFYLTSTRALNSDRFAGDSHAYTISRVTGRVFEFQYDDGTWRRRFH